LQFLHQIVECVRLSAALKPVSPATPLTNGVINETLTFYIVV